MTICTNCILPETFPGIKFDSDGICNHCKREERLLEKSQGKKGEYREKLTNLIHELKGRAPSYDAIMAYSGGKDSTYTLKLLKEQYDIRIIALTFDNHFISPVSQDNIDKVTDTLGVDSLRIQTPWPIMKSMFRCTAETDIFPTPTLLRASSICTSCIGLVKSLVLKTALEMSIPMVAFGWSPGQAPIQSAIMKTNPALIRQNQSALRKAFPAELVEKMGQYFIPESYYPRFKESFPRNIHPLAFFDYNEETIKHELYQLGWKDPSDTDTNSTNCLLNAFANHCHLKRHGFHPYVWEIANMVRQGIIDRNEGIEKIYTEQDKDMVAYAREKLGL